MDGDRAHLGRAGRTLGGRLQLSDAGGQGRISGQDHRAAVVLTARGVDLSARYTADGDIARVNERFGDMDRAGADAIGYNARGDVQEAELARAEDAEDIAAELGVSA